MLFLNFKGQRVCTAKDVDDIRGVVRRRCHGIGCRFPAIVNYDNFDIDPELIDA